jgi:hypothetical protein
MIRSNGVSITSHPKDVTQIMSRSSLKSSDLNTVWLSVLRWTAAVAKRFYPIILIFSLFAAALAATIALRLAIWLPMYLHLGSF